MKYRFTIKPLIALLLLISSISAIFAAELMSKNFEAVLIEGFNLQSKSVTNMLLTDIPENTSHVKVKTSRKKIKGSNLLSSKKKIKKVLTDSDGNRFVQLKFKTKKFRSKHNVQIELLQRIEKRRFVKVGLETIDVTVNGIEECPAKTKPVCGFTRLNQFCSDKEGEEQTCLQVLSSEHLSYRNVCEMEKAGAEILHKGRCRIEGLFPNQPL